MFANTTPNFRVALLVLALAACALFGFARAADRKPVPPMEADIMKECGTVVAVFFVQIDGSTERVPVDSGNVTAVLDLVRVSERVRVFTMDCEAVGHDSIR